MEQPNQLVRIYAGDKEESPQSSSDPDYLDIRSQTKTMTGIIANGVRNITLEVEGRKRRLGGTFVSANYFQVLGVKALLGQTFNDSAVSPDSPPVAVISYRLSTVLLIGTGLLVNTLRNIQQVNLGFLRKEMLSLLILPGELSYNDYQLVVFYRQLLERMQSLPGVKQASLAQHHPLDGIDSGQTQPVSIPGYKLPPGIEHIPIRYNVVWPNYFETMGTRIIQGRAFSGQDGNTGQRVVMINESMARRFWPGQNPVGKRFLVSNRDCEVNGVAEDGDITEMDTDAIINPANEQLVLPPSRQDLIVIPFLLFSPNLSLVESPHIHGLVG